MKTNDKAPNIEPEQRWVVTIQYNIKERYWDKWDKAFGEWNIAYHKHDGSVTINCTSAGPCWYAYIVIDANTKVDAMMVAQSFVELVRKYHGTFDD